MLGALVAPELILGGAYEEWTKSCRELKIVLGKFRSTVNSQAALMLIFHSDAYPNCEWTEMHAMFAFTGGFRAVGPNSSEQLFDTRFFEYIAEKKIDLPDVSLEEIQDKSKGDYIAQTVTVIQTLWFALQAINRTVQGLPVTALELTTLAHVAFNVFICCCWWNKPLNVMVPIDVPLKEGESQEQKGGEVHQQVDKGSEGQSVPEPQSDGDTFQLVKVCRLLGIVDRY